MQIVAGWLLRIEARSGRTLPFRWLVHGASPCIGAALLRSETCKIVVTAATVEDITQSSGSGECCERLPDVTDPKAGLAVGNIYRFWPDPTRFDTSPNGIWGTAENACCDPDVYER